MDIEGTALACARRLIGGCERFTVAPEASAIMLPLFRPRRFNRHMRSPSPTAVTTPPRAPPITAGIGTDRVGGGVDVGIDSAVSEPADVEPAKVAHVEHAGVGDDRAEEMMGCVSLVMQR